MIVGSSGSAADNPAKPFQKPKERNRGEKRRNYLMQELDVQTIFGVLLRKCKLIILFTVIGALLFGAYTRFFVAETYKSEFEMYVISYRDQNSTTAQGMSSSQLMAAQDLVNEYIVVIVLIIAILLSTRSRLVVLKNPISIFNTSTSISFNVLKDEYPLPKSSIST